MARIDSLPNFLTDVADAIKSKTGDNTSIPASQFDTKITNLETTDDDFHSGNSTYTWSAGYAVTSVDIAKKLLLYVLIKKIPYLEISFPDITSLAGSLRFCINLEEIDVSGWDVSTITGFSFMFQGCSSLKEIDLNNWTTGTLAGINGMFQNCSSLETAFLGSLEGSCSINNLFTGCTSLEYINISGLDLVNCTNQSTFLGDSTASPATNVPYNCEIIVADQTQKDFMTTNFPNYTNVRIRGA